MLLTGIAIFFARLIDVSLGTLKLKAVMRGNKLHAFVIAFFEVTIYMLAASSAFKYINDPAVLVLYSLGYAAGNFLGIIIDERLSAGDLYVLLIADHDEDTIALADYLRKKGFGVTTQKGWGLNGSEKMQLKAIVSKKKFAEFQEIVTSFLQEKRVFISVLEVKEVKSVQCGVGK